MPQAFDKNKIARALFQHAEKAWRGGGGMGASSGLGGHGGGGGGHGVSKPGSRGGKFWINASGHVEYGAKPSGTRGKTGGAAKPAAKPQAAVRTGHGGGSGKPKVGELRAGYRIKPQTASGKLQTKKRMLTEMDRAISSGKDPHGNPLSPKAHEQLKVLATQLRTELRGSTKKEQLALAIKAASSFTAYKNYAQKDFIGLDVPEVVVEPQQEHTGVMVAFYLPPEVAVQLIVPGGELPEELHLTLAFLGDSNELGDMVEQELYQFISQFVSNQNPVEGMISGTGLFNNTEEGDSNAFYASFDSPALFKFRYQLIEFLQAGGIEPLQNHGFTPHITLEYVPKGQPPPAIEPPALPVIFTEVTVKWGDKRTDFHLGSLTKEVKTEITTKELTAKPFTTYKDVNGRWRWLVRSSSAFLDGDKETVSLKALEAATQKLNARNKFGILDWWHTPVKLGTCDFSAMHGKILVESGTFASELLGERISTVIASKEFEPGVSLMFAHNEPGPQVVPGRVFDDIEIIQRSLLPAYKASNLATTMEVINLAANSGLTTKEVILKMDAVKEQRLKELLGPQLVEQFLAGSAMAEKQLELTGLSWKAMAPVPPPPPPVVTDPTKKKLDMKADGVMAGDPNALVEGSPEEEAAETPEEEAAEPPDPGEEDMAGGDADQIIQGLYDEVDAIIGRRMQSTADEIVAKLSSIKSTTTSDETGQALVIALKENTQALNAVITENTALKARLDALEGKQPPVVAQRASAAKSNQVTNPELIEALKAQNQPTVDPNDPFAFAYNGWNAAGAPLPLNR